MLVILEGFELQSVFSKIEKCCNTMDQSLIVVMLVQITHVFSRIRRNHCKSPEIIK